MQGWRGLGPPGAGAGSGGKRGQVGPGAGGERAKWGLGLGPGLGAWGGTGPETQAGARPVAVHRRVPLHAHMACGAAIGWHRPPVDNKDFAVSRLLVRTAQAWDAVPAWRTLEHRMCSPAPQLQPDSPYTAKF